MDAASRFADYLAAERGLSPTTVATYAAEARSFLAYFAGERGMSPDCPEAPGAGGQDRPGCADLPDLGAASPADVIAWIVKRQLDGLDPRTLAKSTSAIRSFFRFLVLEGECAANPARQVDSPKTGSLQRAGPPACPTPGTAPSSSWSTPAGSGCPRLSI
jgi:integrase/recombinase XerC